MTTTTDFDASKLEPGTPKLEHGSKDFMWTHDDRICVTHPILHFADPPVGVLNER